MEDGYQISTFEPYKTFIRCNISHILLTQLYNLEIVMHLIMEELYVEVSV